MIINPSHEITLSGLPSEILDAYVRYKKGSRAIVAWLVQFGSDKYTHVKTLPIKELASLAQRVSYKINEVPEVIHFHFKETISARRCLSRFFRSNVDESEGEVDTINHEHFTNSLDRIYCELCERCRTADVKRQARKAGHGSSSISKSVHNHFECLSVEDTNQVETLMTAYAPECVECKDPNQKSCDSTAEGFPQIEDDEVSTAVETILLIERLRTAYATAEECWSQAGRGCVSFIAAAATTNIAWRKICDVEAQLQHLDSKISLTKLQRTCRLVEDHATKRSPGRKSRHHDLLEKLESSEHSLRRQLDVYRSTTIPACTICIQKPASYLKASSSCDWSCQDSFQVALLDNVVRLINQANHAPTLVFSCTPCFTEISHLLSTGNARKHLLQGTTAAHLLFTTYKAYISSLPVPSAVSMCRVTSLKMAKQAASSINTLLSDKVAFPCQCPQTLGYHLSNLQHDLESYAKHKCWDLYFQSPWVAGNHIIEMLDILSYYGMRLFHYRHHVGAVLHTYNVLQQLAGLEKIPLLEELCSVFGVVLFPGGQRPKGNFKNSWSRFVGARLRFKQGHSSQSHRESWCMAVSAHAARAAAGLNSDMNKDRTDPKFDYGRVNLLIKLKQQAYRVSDDDDNDHGLLEDESHTSRRQSSLGSKSKRKSQIATEAESVAVAAAVTVTTTVPASPSNDTRSGSAAEAETEAQAGAEKAEPGLKSKPLISSLHRLNDSLVLSSSSTDANGFSIPTTRLNLISIFVTFTRIVSQISLSTHSPPSSPTSPSNPSNENQNANCICFLTTILSAADRITTGRQQQKIETSYWRKEEREVVETVKKVLLDNIGTVEGKNKDKTNGWKDEWLWDLGVC